MGCLGLSRARCILVCTELNCNTILINNTLFENSRFYLCVSLCSRWAHTTEKLLLTFLVSCKGRHMSWGLKSPHHCHHKIPVNWMHPSSSPKILLSWRESPITVVVLIAWNQYYDCNQEGWITVTFLGGILFLYSIFFLSSAFCTITLVLQVP